MVIATICDGVTVDVSEVLLTRRERAALRWPDPLKPSEWSERYRELPRSQSDRPGPWRNDNAPILRGIMDLAVAPGVSELAIQKCAQGGGSEAIRCLLGYLADYEPDPIGLALPNQAKGEEVVNDRLLPLFRDNPRLRALMSARAHDAKKSQIKLRNGMIIHLMWSGSPASMATHPMRAAVCDEVDKFLLWAGREGKPIDLIRVRLRTYGDRALLIAISTPTTELGEIHQLFLAADHQLYYLVPCPHCQARQRLLFPQLKFPRLPDEARPDWARRVLQTPPGEACWYECLACGGKIAGDEGQRRAMLMAGYWGVCDETGAAVLAEAPGGWINAAGGAERVARWPRKTRLGMQFSALYCLWTPWSDIAAEFIRAGSRLDLVYTFRTGTLGEPFAQEIEKISHAAISAKSLAPGSSAALPEGVLPTWCVKLLATIDVQKDHFYVVLRGWGPGLRSHRVWHGRVESGGPGTAADFTELDKLLFGQAWAFDGGRWPALTVDLALIDSGGTKLAGERASRTMDIYRYALTRRAQVRAIKGMSKPSASGLYIVPSKGFYDPGDKRQARLVVPLWMIDSHHFQDELAQLMSATLEEHGADGVMTELDRWETSGRDDPVYNQHLANLRKVVVMEGAKKVEAWRPVSDGARHDYRDAEGYQVAAAYMARVHVLPPLEVVDQIRQAELEEHRRRTAPGSSGARGGLTTPDGRPFSVLDR